MKLLGGMALGALASAVVLHLIAPSHRGPHTRLVAEDASAPLSRIAIHYAPSSDQVALGVWRQLFAALPPEVEVDVEVAAAGDFDRFEHLIAADGHLERFHPVVVGTHDHDVVARPLRRARRRRRPRLDPRAAAPRGPDVPRAPATPARRSRSRARSTTASRASPTSCSRAAISRRRRTLVFADVNLAGRNLGHGASDRASIEREIAPPTRAAARLARRRGRRRAAPPHHDVHDAARRSHDRGRRHPRGRRAARATDAARARRRRRRGRALRSRRRASCRRAASRSCACPRSCSPAPARTSRTRTRCSIAAAAASASSTCRPTRCPRSTRAGARVLRGQGFEVHPIDVTPIYRLNGSLGCLVNVLARATG